MRLLEWDPKNIELNYTTEEIRIAGVFLDSWITRDHLLRRSGKLDKELATLIHYVRARRWEDDQQA